jgi:predicted NBD/HSP70 family sugar kinase
VQPDGRAVKARDAEHVAASFPGPDLTADRVWTSLAQVCKKGTQTLRLRRVGKGQRSETVHRANLSAIVRGLHEHGPMSRSELVAATGLTRSAIRDLVGELAAGGLVAEEAAIRDGTPGRPSAQVRVIPTSAVVIGIEILVDSMAAAIVGLGGEVFRLVRVDHPRGHLSIDHVVGGLVELTQPLLDEAGDALVGIAAAVAGVVRTSDGLVSMAPNLGWVDAPLGARLRRAFGPSVPLAVGNEADLGVLAEHRRGAATGVDDVLFVMGEVGVGGGILVGGRLLSGAAGFGGEIGHMPLNPGGSPCRCGSIGCWETEVGEGPLLALAGLPPDAGRGGIEEVLQAAAAGVPAAVQALDHVGRWLGIGLSALINVLNPQLVVLGGVHGRIYPAVRPALMAELERRSLPAPRAVVRIVPSSLGSDASLLGAAELALEPLLADPAAWFARRQANPHAASA